MQCRRVWQEISNFIDDDIDSGLRVEIAHHLRHCRRCFLLHDTLRKVLYILADDRAFELPEGYSERLHGVLETRVGKA